MGDGKIIIRKQQTFHLLYTNKRRIPYVEVTSVLL
jgi:hypothetical protein